MWGRIQRLRLRLHDAVSIPSPRQQASLGHHNRMPGFWSRLLFSYGLHVYFSWFLLPASLGETPFYPKKPKGSYNGGVRLLLLQSSWRKAPAWGGGFNSTWMMTGFVFFFTTMPLKTDVWELSKCNPNLRRENMDEVLSRSTLGCHLYEVCNGTASPI